MEDTFNFSTMNIDKLIDMVCNLIKHISIVVIEINEILNKIINNNNNNNYAMNNDLISITKQRIFDALITCLSISYEYILKYNIDMKDNTILRNDINIINESNALY